MSPQQKSSRNVFLSVLGVFAVAILTFTLASGQKLEQINTTSKGLEKLEDKVDEYHRQTSKKFDEHLVLLYSIKAELKKGK